MLNAEHDRFSVLWSIKRSSKDFGDKGDQQQVPIDCGSPIKINRLAKGTTDQIAGSIACVASSMIILLTG